MPRFEALIHYDDGSRSGYDRSLGTFETALEALEVLRKDGCVTGRIVNLKTNKSNIYIRKDVSCTGQ